MRKQRKKIRRRQRFSSFSLGRKRVVPVIISALFGLAIAGSVVQFAVLRRQSFFFRTAGGQRGIAVFFVFLVGLSLDTSWHVSAPTIITRSTLFLWRSSLLARPQLESFIGALNGGLITRYISADRS
jgi:hypothetical protein